MPTILSAFGEPEQAYLAEQRLGRLATVGPDEQPHVTPVGFGIDAESGGITITGYDFAETKKFRDAETHPQVAFVVDDLASVDPWRPRGVEIRGDAATFREGGEERGPGSDGAWLLIRPTRIISWGLRGADA